MPITEKQRQARKTKIGSSDVGAILNLDPFKTDADVCVSKTTDMADLQPTTPMQIGNYLEEGLLRLAASEMGYKDIRCGYYRVSKDNGLFAANIDAIIVDRPEAIEAKVVSGESRTLQMWGANGTDEVPDHVMCQVQHQMYCADLETVHVAAYLAGKFRIYHVPRDDELIHYQVGYCVWWWDEHVVRGIWPDNNMPSIETLKRIRRSPKSVAKIDGSLADAYSEAVRKHCVAERKLKQAKQAVLAAMVDAEAADWGDDDTVITYMEQTREGVDLKRLRAELPAVASEYSVGTKCRTLRKQKRSNFTWL